MNVKFQNPNLWSKVVNPVEPGVQCSYNHLK